MTKSTKSAETAPGDAPPPAATRTREEMAEEMRAALAAEIDALDPHARGALVARAISPKDRERIRDLKTKSRIFLEAGQAFLFLAGRPPGDLDEVKAYTDDLLSEAIAGLERGAVIRAAMAGDLALPSPGGPAAA